VVLSRINVEYDYLPFLKQNVPVIFNAVSYSISTVGDEELRNKMQSRLHELIIIKFELYGPYINLKKYESGWGIIEFHDISLELSSYVIKNKKISYKEIEYILSLLKKFKFEFDKKDYEYIKSIENMIHKIVLFLDMENLYSYLSTNQLIDVLFTNRLKLEDETWKLIYIENYNNTIDELGSTISEMIDCSKQLIKASLWEVEHSGKIFDPILIERILGISENLQKWLVSYGTDDAEDNSITFIDFASTVNNYREVYEEFFGIVSTLNSLSVNFSLVESIDGEDIMISVNWLLDLLVDVIYNNNVAEFNTFSHEKLMYFVDTIHLSSSIEQEKTDEYIVVDQLDDFKIYSIEKMKKFCIDKISKLSKDDYYKSYRIMHLNEKQLIDVTDVLFDENYDWFGLLTQAEFLLQYFKHNNNIGFVDRNIDWTFVYVILTKSFENLFANFLSFYWDKIPSIARSNFYVIKNDHKHYIDMNDKNWRISMAIGDLQKIFHVNFSPYVGSFIDANLLNSRIKHLFRDERNAYLHHESLSTFAELTNLFEGTYILILIIFSMIFKDIESETSGKKN
jgi:hypothetical protein